jgi:uncharacterized coiled-coil protein SlyX
MQKAIITHGITAIIGAALTAILVYAVVYRPATREYASLDAERRERIADLEQSVTERDAIIEERSLELAAAIATARDTSARLEEIVGELERAHRSAIERATAVTDGLAGDRELTNRIADRTDRIQELATELDRAIRAAIGRAQE